MVGTQSGDLQPIVSKGDEQLLQQKAETEILEPLDKDLSPIEGCRDTSLLAWYDASSFLQQTALPVGRRHKNAELCDREETIQPTH
eukprot:2912771-Amphidinium_carterae.2